MSAAGPPSHCVYARSRWNIVVENGDGHIKFKANNNDSKKKITKEKQFYAQLRCFFDDLWEKNPVNAQTGRRKHNSQINCDCTAVLLGLCVF